MIRNQQNVKEMVAYISSELKTALLDFGIYTFNDKGPQEVMDIGTIISKLQTLSLKEIGIVIRILNEEHASHEMSGLTDHLLDIFGETLSEQDFETIYELCS